MKFNTFLLICFGMVIIGCSSDDSSGDTDSCEKPTALTATNITAASADLGWTETGSATMWDIEFGESGFVPTGTPTTPNVSNPYTVSGLTGGTTYEFYVRANCGEEQSEWSGPKSFTYLGTGNPKDYFPLAETNSWTYANQKTYNGSAPVESEETMTAGTASEENGMMYYPMESSNPDGSGFVTNVFSNGTLHQDGDQTIYNGSIIIEVDQLDMDPIEIMIDNGVLFSENAAAGTQLFSYEGSETQTLNIGITVPVTMEYMVTTTNVEFLETYTTPNGNVYEDVLRADLSISGAAFATYNGVPITVMANQDVVTTTNYYANGVGMIYSSAINNYEFEDLSGFGLPVIPDVHIEGTQELTAYTLN